MSIFPIKVVSIQNQYILIAGTRDIIGKININHDVLYQIGREVNTEYDNVNNISINSKIN